MLNIGAGEIAVILVVALLVLGPKRLPELARGIGKFLREFRKQTDEVRSTLETEFYRMDQDLLREDPPPPPAPVPQKPYTQLPAITGPLDGGRRPADEIETTKPQPQPVPPQVAAPVAEPAPAVAPVAAAAPAAEPAPSQPAEAAQPSPGEPGR